MELVTINKYQSIADRIKRLEHSQQQAITTPTFPSLLSPRTKTTNYNHNQNNDPKQSYKSSYAEKKNTSRITTQETEQNANQQSYTIIDDLRSIRETQYQANYGQERSTIGYQYDQSSFLEEIKKQKHAKQLAQSYQKQSRNRTLSKIKSENSLKMDEILQSYNSYKQNKQQFISQVKKNSQTNHHRGTSQTIRKPANKDKVNMNDVSFQKKPQKVIVFNSIDNMWNENTQEDQQLKISLAQSQNRNRTKTEQILMRVASLKQQQTKRNYQNSSNQNKPNSKFILKNLTTDPGVKEQSTPKMNLLLSPRGLRAPGKICKNHDKSIIRNPV